MSAVSDAAAILEVDEGYRQFAYTDTVGKQTIGYGFNLAVGLTQPEAACLLAFKVGQLDTALQQFIWYAGLNDARKSAILNMAYNLGLHGLLQFKQMLTALEGAQWAVAKAQCLDSDAARMLPTRYGRIADTLLTGQPQGD